MTSQASPSLAHRPIKPERVLALGFLAVILLGGLLLALPISGAGGRSIGVRGALFTATSAVCVTGLSIVDVGTELSLLGQCVLLLLIQVGGLGFMAFATLIMVALGKRVSLHSRMILRDSMNQTSLSGMVRLSLSFFALAIGIETVGALLLMIRFIPLYGAGRGIWYSFFTAVSAFCNAGFDLFGGYRSLTHMACEPLVLLTLALLIILGGLGFSVLFECVRTRMRWRAFSLHAKLVLCLTGTLLLCGTLATFALEASNPNTLGAGMGFGAKLLNSFFQSTTLRTAGFASMDQAKLTDASKLLGCLFMFIGASSASTGGGIKTTTAVMLWLVVWSVIRGRDHITVFGREISADTARRSMTIAFIGFAMVLLSACALSVIERGRGFSMLDLAFETTSAFSTTGLSSANTPGLRPASQWLLMPLMYFGRVGPLTLAAALASRAESGHINRVRHPEEKIMIG